MKSKSFTERSLLTVSVVGSLVFLNILGLRAFGRIDLTRDRQFTLSSATEDTLGALEDPVTVRAYFTRDLPAPFSAHARYVRDLLEEYYVHAHGNLRYEFIDPVSAESEADREKKKEIKHDIFGRAVREQTSVERELAGLGITPVQVRVNEGDKLEVKRAYMGIVVSHGGKREAIPVVQDTAGLEYNLTTLIRKLARSQRPKVVLVTGNDSPDPQRKLGRLIGLLQQLYDFSMVDLSTSPEIPAGTDAILVVAPHTALTQDEVKAIDEFVSSGGSAAFLLDAVKADLQKLKADEVDAGLGSLLAAYGVEIEPGLVLDTECATLTVARQQGFMRIQEPVRYPFIPQPKGLDPTHPLTRGLSNVIFPFMSPLRMKEEGRGSVQAHALVRSSARSWVQRPPYDLNPLQRWTREAAGKQEAHPILVALSGTLAGPYAQSGTNLLDDDTNSRVVVAGGASFVTDQFLAKGNEALVLNLMDWLVRDDALLAIRTRGLRAAPLNDTRDSTRALLKYANILGVPLLCIVLGLVRWRRRESRRARVYL